MPIIITDSDNISTLHFAERLQSNLSLANEVVEDMVLEIYFTTETHLPNGKLVGQVYWDNEPLRITCKGNPELTEAMKVIQQAIGYYRYLQLTTPKEQDESPPNTL
jgi:hypothetical protein